MVGESLGPYLILEPIGAGGMGQVYVAMDTRLRRKVAIKVLPQEFASDPERLARFIQEARAAAALNHARIAAIHDVGEADGVHFMVQEYLQGSTLKDLLADRALPLKRALHLGAEIAEAIAAAHASSIVHRDLKPANIFVVDGGHAKVLDFGLAKLMHVDKVPDDDSTRSPTIMGTTAGTIMGTAGYMAPEQIRGGAIDARTDVFAFGCVLYEMVSGERAFRAGTAVEVLNAILNAEPTPLAEIDPGLPRDLVRIIGKCLAKEPGRRYQNSDDLLVDLQTLGDDVGRDSALSIGSFLRAEARERPTPWPLRRPLWWGAVAVAVVLTASLTGYAGREWLSRRPVSAPTRVTRFTIDLPAEQELTQSAWTLPLALSPDGRRMVYTAGVPSQLYLRDFDTDTSRPIPGTENGDSPFFSPDGEWVGFFDSLESLKRVRLATGEVQEICICRYDGGGVVWRPDDTILFVSVSRQGELLGVPAAGGNPTTVVKPELEANPSGADSESDSGMFIPTWPTLMPDGVTVLALLYADSREDEAFIGAVSATGQGWRRLTEPGFLGEDPAGPLRYAVSGHLVYASPAGLVAVPFDPDRLEVLGAPTRVTPPVEQPASYGSPAFFTVSAGGSLVAASPRPESAKSSLVWVDHQGVVTPLRATAGDYGVPRLSPDGTGLAVNSGGHVWLIDLVRDTETRLSDRKSPINGHPAWDRGGAEVVLARGISATSLVWMRTDSTGASRTLSTDGVLWANAWAPDGSLLVTRYLPGEYDIVALPFDENHEPLPPVPVVVTPANEGAAALSPDGRWLAYASDESGRFEVYAQPYLGPGRRWTISTNGGSSPAWAPAGDELYYRDGSRMMTVTVDPASNLDPGRPRVLFDDPALVGVVEDGVGRNYDIAPDDERFVMIQAPGPWSPRLSVVLNWFVEVRTRAPAPR